MGRLKRWLERRGQRAQQLEQRMLRKDCWQERREQVKLEQVQSDIQRRWQEQREQMMEQMSEQHMGCMLRKRWQGQRERLQVLYLRLQEQGMLRRR